MSRKAFTLIELLIVVLIIGVLSAIAIPMYQGAVDKSHWSTMLPGAKAIKDAEGAIKMSNGEYTSEMANLDVTMENNDLTFNLITPNNTSDPNVIRVTNSKLDNVRLASYLDDSPMFAGQLHCEALTGDERANRLCEKLLNGQELTSIDGYTGYLLDQEITQATCKDASRSWSTSKTKCYKDTATRCTDLGMGVVASMDDQCGYENENNKKIGSEEICFTETNSCMGLTIENGGACIVTGGARYGCRDPLKINSGGICISINTVVTPTSAGASCGSSRTTVDEGIVICNNNTDCGWHSTYQNGSICVGNGTASGCNYATFTDDSICYANGTNSCNSSFDSTSCCCGAYCGSKPACADRGKTCDPYYMNSGNFTSAEDILEHFSH